MNRKPFVVGIIAVALLLGVGVPVFYGGGPITTDAPNDTRPTQTALATLPAVTAASPTPPPTPASASTPAPDRTSPPGRVTPRMPTPTPTGTPPSTPYTFRIDAITRCGDTCRDVTATLVNHRREPASNVVVVTRVFAGVCADPRDVVWDDEYRVGTLAPAESATATNRVVVSYAAARSIHRSDGVITVRSDTAPVTFEDRRDVF